MARSPDVIIVGGGVIGCALAYALAKERVRVLVLEQHQVGSGATYASAGMVAPLSDSPAGHPLMDLGLQSYRMYEAWVREVEEASGFSIECLPSGILRIALTEEDEGELKAGVRHAAKLGFAVQWLGTEDALEVEPLLSPRIRGASFSPGEPQLNASRYVEALRRAALARGATFLEQTPAVGLARNGAKATGVRTPKETIRAGRVVIAAGSWSAQAGDWLGLRVPVSPVRGQVVYVDKLAQPLKHTVMRHSSYAVPKGDGTTLVGTTREDAGFDQRVTVGGVASILTHIQDLVPSIAQAAINHTRAGLRPASADELPILGPAPTVENVILATGHGRSGILLTPVTVRIVTGLMLNDAKAPDLGPYSAARLERTRS